ncbi:metallophosphoesterase [Geomonas sp. Red69]|uniref:metallophosphoesterase family protein n=1 Tax=Geomonas diazotrophica TaxID=2843197 RepID=UPI001C1216F3|nr:metallophosphoesterase family protein [Geomonas diazotrophica]MBU5639067.1 metallophosphoesterase [Geomonas diazotrophica]
MAIIASDIHGDPAAARAFLEHKPAELHVCLGDLVDGSHKPPSFEKEAECLDLLLESDSVLLWGNHDLAYLPERPWKSFSNFDEFAFRKQFALARDRFSAAYAIDGWLCTHAGIAPGLARRMPQNILPIGVEAVAKWINEEFIRESRVENIDVETKERPRYGHGSLFSISVSRGGTDGFGGIFWFDAEREQSQPSHLLPQIFGHSPNDRPIKGVSVDLVGSGISAPWINVATHEGCWIYDTKRAEFARIL